jgi:acetyl esterase/lipase
MSRLSLRSSRSRHTFINAESTLKMKVFTLAIFCGISALSLSGWALGQVDQPMIVEPKPSEWETFPESTASAPGILTIKADPSDLSCKLHANVLYATKSSVPLHLHIIVPRQREGEERRFPLVVYVQGSAWFEQDLGYEIPQLSQFARKGDVVAVVEYRPSPVAPFPAQLKDAKTAIRFLIRNAAAYSIDPDRIALWGDSSGGHTAVMTSVTLTDPQLTDESPTDEPIKLKASVDFYGPVDVSKMNFEPSTQDHRDAQSPEGMLIGGRHVLENPDKVRPTVPINYVDRNKEIPPFLIIHGNKDRLVPFGQSVLLYEALKQNDKSVVMYKLDGADHGGSPFWTDQVLTIVDGFLREHL